MKADTHHVDFDILVATSWPYEHNARKGPVYINNNQVLKTASMRCASGSPRLGAQESYSLATGAKRDGNDPLSVFNDADLSEDIKIFADENSTSTKTSTIFGVA